MRFGTASPVNIHLFDQKLRSGRTTTITVVRHGARGGQTPYERLLVPETKGQWLEELEALLVKGGSA